MRMSFAARTLAAERGLTGKHVFFNEEWVRYDDRSNYLMDADVGVSNHLDHVETAFSFRTRMLDYLWASLPMVCTQGDVFAALVDARGLGLTVAPGDVEGLADALERVLYDEVFAQRCRDAVRETAPEYHWERVLTPLVAFCRSPRRAPDLLDAHARRQMVRSAGERYKPKTGLRRDLEIAADHLRDGGVVKVASKAVSRLAYVTGRKTPPPAARLSPTGILAAHGDCGTTGHVPAHRVRAGAGRGRRRPPWCCRWWTPSRGSRPSPWWRSAWSGRR
jgi:hypothetical protein